MTAEKSAEIRVLVVDDLPAARRAIRSALEEDPAIVIVGEACNGEEAVEMAARLLPDVITMDVVMPVLDGYAATARIMAHRPTPVVAVTSLSTADGSVLAGMLGAGAIDLVTKGFPRHPARQARMRRELVAKVKAAAQARVGNCAMRSADGAKRPARSTEPPSSAPRPASQSPCSGSQVASRSPQPAIRQIVVVAASTGGPGALWNLLGQLPADFPCPLLVVQHIAAGFGGWLARWLDQAGSLRVKVAEDGEHATAGWVYLAPEEHHLLITPQLAIRLNEALPVHSLRPSADVLFRSAAQSFGSGAVAVVLTGMGNDGADGASFIKDAGGVVIAQDAETSAVFGMPRATVAAGAATVVLPLQEIAGRLVRETGVKA